MSLSDINTYLDGFFKHSIEEAVSIDPSYERLWVSLRTLSSSGGKRIRPGLTLLAYEAFGGQQPQLMIPIAAAQELLHFSLLIHDDIIDRDDTRYGIANINGQYKQFYAADVTDESNREHYAHSAAILAGDLMLSYAHHMVASSQLQPQQRVIAHQLLTRGIFEVAGGELLDTELSFSAYHAGDALKVAEYKTASYSFVTPLLTGARIAGATPAQQAALRTYGLALGTAYQLIDDLLGVFGDTEKTGKSTISDIVEGKQTYLIELARQNFTPADSELFDTIFGNPAATESQIATVRDLLQACGAREKMQKKIDEYTALARESVAKLSLHSDDTQQFLQLINKATQRVS